MSTLIRGVRLVPVGSPGPVGEPGPVAEPAAHPVDLRISDGVVTEVAPAIRAQRTDEVHDAQGRWAIPGLWDQHVHMVQWAQTLVRLDVSGTSGPEEVTRLVRQHVAGLPPDRAGTVVSGWGHRSATWSRQPTVAELDAVSADHPVILVSGDGHNGWLNSRALQMLDVAPRTGALDENDWFPVFPRLSDLPGAAEASEAAFRRAVGEAAARGVVGVVDFEFGGDAYRDWPDLVAQGVDQLRVRTATYPERLDEVVAAGLRSGSDLPGGEGLLTMGPLKVISDGSLNTRTAYCEQPYADAGSLQFPRGKQNYSADELTALLYRARQCGLSAAVHAIGDAAVASALDAFEATGAAGSLEHVQLVAWDDIPRMSRLKLRASVQPAHLLDDRTVTEQCWPDRADRCFALRSLVDAGVVLALGSDAPVARLDPWLAMAAAVHRAPGDDDPWHAEQSLSAAEALAASTDGRRTLAVGEPGDVVLLDDDPLRPLEDAPAVAAHLRRTSVAATFVAGRPTHLAV